MKALATVESLGDQPQIAAACHQLGWVARDRGRFDEAESWYKKSLAIYDALGDRRTWLQATLCSDISALARGLRNEAEGWFGKALTIFEALGDEPNKAIVLGSLAKLKAVQGESTPQPSLWTKLRRAFT